MGDRKHSHYQLQLAPQHFRGLFGRYWCRRLQNLLPVVGLNLIVSRFHYLITLPLIVLAGAIPLPVAVNGRAGSIQPDAATWAHQNQELVRL